MLVWPLITGSNPALAEENSPLEPISFLQEPHDAEISQQPDSIESDAPEEEQSLKPQIKFGHTGLSFTSADENLVVRLRGYAQIDKHFDYFPNPQYPTSFFPRRIRPTLEGTLFKTTDIKIMPEYGKGRAGEMYDMYADYHYSHGLNLQVGKYVVPFGLERIMSRKNMMFIESPLNDNLLPNRDFGAQLHGDLFSNRLYYAAGLMHGSVDGDNSRIGDHFESEFTGRLFATPFRLSRFEPLQKLGFGGATTVGDEHNMRLPKYRSSARERFFSYIQGTHPDGLHYRVTPQAYYYWRGLSVMTEYVLSSQALQNTVNHHTGTMDNHGGEVTLGYLLTGEHAGYDQTLVPLRPFNPLKNHWGALEVLARYSTVHVDSQAFPYFASPKSSASAARCFEVGMNWYLNQNLKYMLNFDHTLFTGGGGSLGVDRPHENALLMRFQLAF